MTFRSRSPIAILGAGLAGLSCARALREAGLHPRLLDKGRAAGGRLATRRAEGADGARLAFDHGAQYLTARGPGFAAALREAGAGTWPEPGRLVGQPGMSALPRALAADFDLVTACQVTAIEGAPGAWMLRHAAASAPEGGTELAGPFGALLLTLPAPQAAPLLAPHAPAWASRLAEEVAIAPCWTLMLGFSARLPLPDTLRPGDGASPIAWAARDSAKPGRDPGTECWVVQAGPAWSRAHLERPAAEVAAELTQSLAELAGMPLPTSTYAAAHRWRFALVERPLGEPCLWDPALGLGLAGDWCLAPRGEAAWDSGAALAAAVLRG